MVNMERRNRAPEKSFTGESSDDTLLRKSPGLELGYIVAMPRMAKYLEYSTRIYDIYLKYVAPEDILVYSIDEVFIDVTGYLKTYGLSAHELTMKMIRDVLQRTGITATAGIGTNLFLSKVAMDIVAKHMPADKDGVRIAELNERTFREKLWDHRPLTDFWRVGRGYAKKLEGQGLYTMGDIARCSLGEAGSYYNEDLLYQMFGVNAELLIDHAWGWEPCTMKEIKAYRPSTKSIGSGQVLQGAYGFDKARLVVREMADSLSLDLARKALAAEQIVLQVGYDIDSLKDSAYKGAITSDHYGRRVPKPAHGSINLPRKTSSTRLIVQATLDLFDRIVDPKLLVRRLTISATKVVPELEALAQDTYEQMDLFTSGKEAERRQKEEESLKREKKIQKAILHIQDKYGKNALLKGFNLEEGATMQERNGQIGGHKA